MFVAADPDRLEQAAGQLARAAEQISATETRVTRLLRRSATGPATAAYDRLAAVAPALGASAGRLHGEAGRMVRRAADQRRISAPDASPMATAVVDAMGQGGGQPRYVNRLPNAKRLKNGAVYNTGRRLATLTFDDGPNSRWTPQMLDLLDKYRVKATFFVTGQNATKNPGLVREIVRRGHAIGNHSWNHADLAGKSADAVEDDLRRTNDAIHNALGDDNYEILYARAPYGGWGQNFVPVAKRLGMESMHWSAPDPADWSEVELLPNGRKKVPEDPNDPADIAAKVLQAGQTEGGVILVHDGGADANRSRTYEALRQALPGLAQRLEPLPRR
jgi:peptidoglycan-N-acetylglucosamine deacetylase